LRLSFFSWVVLLNPDIGADAGRSDED